MAINHVQDAFATASVSTSLDITLPSNTGTNNSIGVSIGWGAGVEITSPSVTDDQSNTYLQDEAFLVGTSDARPVAIYRAKSVASGVSTTVTVSQDATEDIRAYVVEVDKPIDKHTSANSDNSSSNSTSHPHGSVTTTKDTFGLTSLSARTDLGGTTPETDWTEGNDHNRHYAMYRTVSGNLTGHDPTADSTNSTKTVGVVAMYEDASGGAAATYGYRTGRQGGQLGADKGMFRGMTAI